jgi:hypothetical protein
MRYSVVRKGRFCRILDRLTDEVAGELYRECDDAYHAELELNMSYDDGGGLRDPASVVRVDPPKKIEFLTNRGVWMSGVLDAWIRQPDGWYGHINVFDEWTWRPGHRLRPTAT